MKVTGVRFTKQVYFSLDEFYAKSIELHPSLDYETISKKKKRLLSRVYSDLMMFPLKHRIARKGSWELLGYRDLVVEQVHFGYTIERNYNGEIFILVHDAIHSKLYHD